MPDVQLALPTYILAVQDDRTLEVVSGLEALRMRSPPPEEAGGVDLGEDDDWEAL